MLKLYYYTGDGANPAYVLLDTTKIKNNAIWMRVDGTIDTEGCNDWEQSEFETESDVHIADFHDYTEVFHQINAYRGIFHDTCS